MKFAKKVLIGRLMICLFAIGSLLVALALGMAIAPLLDGLPATNNVAASALFWSGMSVYILVALYYLIQFFALIADEDRIKHEESKLEASDIEYLVDKHGDKIAHVLAQKQESANTTITFTKKM